MSRSFQTTRWSLVVSASRFGPEARCALAELCEIYWRPVYAFLRHKVGNTELAEDLTQGFFCDLLAREDLARADPGRGRFRSFLLKGAQNFAAKDHSKATAKKRGGGVLPISLDALRDEQGDNLDTADHRTPESVFEQRFARTVLDQAMRRLAEEYAERGRREVFETLKYYLEDTGENRPYAEAAARLELSEGAVKVSVYRLRKRFGEMLVAEVQQTLEPGVDPMDEIRTLQAALRRDPR